MVIELDLFWNPICLVLKTNLVERITLSDSVEESF